MNSAREHKCYAILALLKLQNLSLVKLKHQGNFLRSHNPPLRAVDALTIALGGLKLYRYNYSDPLFYKSSKPLNISLLGFFKIMT